MHDLYRSLRAIGVPAPRALAITRGLAKAHADRGQIKFRVR